MSRVFQAVNRPTPSPRRRSSALLALGAILIVPASVLVGVAFGPPVGIATSVVAAGTWAAVALDPGR